MSSIFPLVALLSATVADAKPAEPQAPDTVMVARKARKISTDPADKQWSKAAPMEVVLSRQRTVSMMDIDANKIQFEAGPRAATIRLLYNDASLGIWVSWPDETKDELNTDDGSYGDAIAMSLPVAFGPGVALPYLGMGDIEHPVVIASKRANRHAEQERQFIAAGFGSLKPIDINTEMSMTYDEAAKTWTAVFLRPLKDGNLDLVGDALIPFSLALWNGSDLERGGYKSVLRWHAIQLQKAEPDPGYLAELRWGEDGRQIGNPAHGKELAGQLCVACHHFDDKAMALPGIAPNLNNVGTQASASYIRDSIMEPSKVVVRNPNSNRHYTKAGGRDHRGGFPVNPMYQWYTLSEDGEFVSKMPQYGHLSETDVNDIVAYMKSLGTTTADASSPTSPNEEQP